MSSETTNTYQVSNVEKIPAPDNSDDKNWYRYEISNKSSSISGQRSGTLKQVTQHAEEFAEQLNERKKGKTNSVYAPKKKQAPAA